MILIINQKGNLQQICEFLDYFYHKNMHNDQEKNNSGVTEVIYIRARGAFCPPQVTFTTKHRLLLTSHSDVGKP